MVECEGELVRALLDTLSLQIGVFVASVGEEETSGAVPS